MEPYKGGWVFPITHKNTFWCRIKHRWAWSWEIDHLFGVQYRIYFPSILIKRRVCSRCGLVQTGVRFGFGGPIYWWDEYVVRLEEFKTVNFCYDSIG